MNKVNLCGNSPEYLNGYLNIVDSLQVDPNSLSENTSIVAGRYSNLDPVLEDDSVDELLLSLPLNILMPDKLLEILTMWKKKLKQGGTLKVWYYDIRRLALEAVKGSMSLEELHNYLIGANKELNCLLDSATMKIVMNSLGFKINILSLSDLIGSLEAINE